jgi:hypothetical protein
VSVVDGIMEGSNSMVFDLTDDLVEHINTNPRLSRPGNNKVKLGLSRRPRVDRSPSRAAAQGGTGTGVSPSSSSSPTMRSGIHDHLGNSYGSNGMSSSLHSHKSTTPSPKPYLPHSSNLSSSINGSNSLSGSNSRFPDSSPKLVRSATIGPGHSPTTSVDYQGSGTNATAQMLSAAVRPPQPYPHDAAGIATASNLPAASDFQPKFGALRRGKSEGRATRTEPDFFS